MDRVDVLGSLAVGTVVLLLALAIGGMFLGFWRGLWVGLVVTFVSVWLALRYVHKPTTAGRGHNKRRRP